MDPTTFRNTGPKTASEQLEELRKKEQERHRQSTQGSHAKAMMAGRESFLILCWLVVVAAAPAAAAGGLTRCVDPASGNVTYSDHECVAAKPDETGDGPCYRQAQIAMKEQVPFVLGGVDALIRKKAPEGGLRQPGLLKGTAGLDGGEPRQWSQSRMMVNSGSSTDHAPTIKGRPVDTYGMVRADPEIVARVLKDGLSPRCRAVLQKSGPNGPEWYGKDIWNSMESQEYYEVVAALQARLNALATVQGRCWDEALRQRVREDPVLGHTQPHSKTVNHDGVAACLEQERVERIERTKIEATLANPEAIRAEAARLRLERAPLRDGLRQPVTHPPGASLPR